MKFIEILITNSQLKEARLYGPSKKASENPEIGITIKNQAAYHVIKDCAKIANKYLPFVVMEHYQNVFLALKGKVQKQDIIEFVEGAQKDIAFKQLLELLLNKAKGNAPISSSSPTLEFTAASFSQNSNDPYGDYGVVTENVPTSVEKTPVDILWEAFS